MSSIAPFAAGSYVSNRNAANLSALKNQIDSLTTQLATGRVAETYGGLGAGRTTSLNAHATLSALDGYDAGIGAAQTRITVAATSLTQVSKLASSTRNNLNTAQVTETNNPAATSTKLARANFEAAVDALNQQAAGYYVFGGREADAPPVLSSDTILDGDANAGRAGLIQLVQEQKTADLGPQGNGNLSQSATGATVSLSEATDAQTRLNFGFTLPRAPSTTGTAIQAAYTPATAPSVGVTFANAPTEGQAFRVVVQQADGSQKTLDITARHPVPAGSTNVIDAAADPTSAAGKAAAKAAVEALAAPGTIVSVQSAPNAPGISADFATAPGTPATLTVSLAAQPAEGDTLTIDLGLHDGTSTQISLKATAGTPGPGQFAIGADADATAANLNAALSTAIGTAASTALAAASTTRAAQDFFAGSPTPGLEPRRIVFANGVATGYRSAGAEGTANAAKTVIWYQGEDSDAAARATASVRTGAASTVDYGARANEAPIQRTLAGLAAIAVGTATNPSAAGSAAAWTALASRGSTLLTGTTANPGVEAVATELSLANSALANAKSGNAATRAAIANTLDGVENVSTEQVATEILAVQNRLQASYQVTSMLSKLSLANFL